MNNFQLMNHPISKIHFSSTLLISLVLSLALISTCQGALLIWDENSESDIDGYKVYSVTSPENYNLIVDVGNVTECELSEHYLYEDTIYYIAITAYDTSGNESEFSLELDFPADDGIPDYLDNCPDIYNPDQEDNYPPDGNNIGDACDCEGNIDCDDDVDGEDVTTFLIDFGRNQYNNPCENGNPCNGDVDCDNDVDGEDVTTLLIDFGRNQYNNPCPACTEEDWCTY